ncbi:MAG: flagellar hook-associated protein FlgL [Gammaproteobacteria bacterium]|jgi:flagellar hook-associated protein 3 FlgL|nr:flagellar hook-associated protein FlgL [Gammaproteobacteria bacterium]MBU0773465.1 flagellar hook-associated protein FlgL [Gammaproteobacteria bacterium]MBU0856675.1 flagellar hook-associated protein FlgL [Gammaproteobacteria bacterium]MBU1846795.1 flagellar hook-associated protein FlgL [Gammaproteobacteria bacterium]
MRVASTQYHATMNTALQDANTRLSGILQQMSNGMRVQRPSDDPIASVRIARLTREEAALDQYLQNIGALRSRLQQNESVLDGMSRDIVQARDLMVWAADGANTTQDLQAMSASLVALRDSLTYSANSIDQEGRYLFSGTATATAPIAYAGAAAVGTRFSFAGNTDEQRVVVGSGVTQIANTTLQEMTDVLNHLDLAIDALQTPGATANDPAIRAVLVNTLNGLDTGLDAVSAKIARLGGAQTTLETLETNHANVSLSNKQAMITFGQLDYGDAAVKLNGYTTAVQATQKAYAKVSALSLFDVV